MQMKANDCKCCPERKRGSKMIGTMKMMPIQRKNLKKGVEEKEKMQPRGL